MLACLLPPVFAHTGPFASARHVSVFVMTNLCAHFLLLGPFASAKHVNMFVTTSLWARFLLPWYIQPHWLTGRKTPIYLLTYSTFPALLFVAQVCKKNAPSIACKDEFGNTALHRAAMHGHAEVAVYLLQSGIDPDIQNTKGKLWPLFGPPPPLKKK